MERSQGGAWQGSSLTVTGMDSGGAAGSAATLPTRAATDRNWSSIRYRAVGPLADARCGEMHGVYVIFIDNCGCCRTALPPSTGGGVLTQTKKIGRVAYRT